MTMAEPVLKWAGGKRQLLHEIDKQLPAAGCSDRHVETVGLPAEEAKATGFCAEELKETEFSADELIDTGSRPSSCRT